MKAIIFYCGKLIRRVISYKVKVLMIFTVNVFIAIPGLAGMITPSFLVGD